MSALNESLDMTGWLPPEPEPQPSQIIACENRSKLLSALFSLPADFYNDRQRWLDVAIAMKREGDGLFPFFDAFSSQSAKYRGTEDSRKVWEGIRVDGRDNPKTVGSIFHNAKQNGWQVDEPPKVATSLDDALSRYPLMTMQQLRQADFREEYIAEGVIVRGMPGIFGAPSKTLKTAKLLDLGYNFSTGGKYLGYFQCVRCRTMTLTGESGGAAVQRRINTFIAKYGREAESGYFFISESLPKFKNNADLSLLSVLLEAKGTEVLIIDPMYMCMGGSEASNIQSQGELLWAISDICRQLGVTLLVAHHVTKSAARDTNRLLTLEDLTQAGFDAWARQWCLISRREKYELGSGFHKLWVAIGNCSSHSAEWAVDVDEGTKDEPRWEVQVSEADEVRADDKASKRAESVEAYLTKVRIVLAQSGGSLSQREICSRAGISSKTWKDKVLPTALEHRTVREVPGKRKNHPHYVLEMEHEQAA